MGAKAVTEEEQVINEMTPCECPNNAVYDPPKYGEETCNDKGQWMRIFCPRCNCDIVRTSDDIWLRADP